MAASNTLDCGRRLLRGLLENEHVLSAISSAIEGTTSQQTPSTGNTATNSAPSRNSDANATPAQNTVRSEVARLFGRGEQAGTTQHPRFVARNNLSGRQQKASSSKSKGKDSKEPKTKVPSGSFINDVVLLGRPEEDVVPRQGSKHYLVANGHVMYGCTFRKEWDSRTVMENIRSLFPDKLKENVKTEIVISVHNKLVTPTLAPGQDLSGFVLRKMVNNKPVYVRPSKEILAPEWLALELETEDNEGKCDAARSKPRKRPFPDSVFEDDNDFCIQSHSALESATTRAKAIDGNDPGASTSTAVEDVEDKDLFLTREYAALFDFDYDAEDAENEGDGLSDTSQGNDDVIITRVTQELTDTDSLDIILTELAETIQSESISKFNICRTHIWDGVVRALKRKSFSPRNRMSVKFTDDHGQSEGAVDLGGPRRELLTLVMLELQQSSLFANTPNGIGKLIDNFGPALKDDHYFYAGLMIAMSFVHGGPAPHFLSPMLFNAILLGPEHVKVEANDVPDYEVKVSLQQLDEATSLEEINAAIGKMSTLLSFAGCMRHVKKQGEQHAIVTETAHWYVFGRTRSAFERFCEGLSALGILASIRKHPPLFKDALCPTTVALTADAVASLFAVHRQDRESNKWKKEGEILAFWMDYLQDAEERTSAVDLTNIMSFATGCLVVPPLGFRPRPEIHFLHGCEDKFPKANTCSCIIHLPVIHAEYENFKNDMDFAILNSHGFGNA